MAIQEPYQIESGSGFIHSLHILPTTKRDSALLDIQGLELVPVEDHEDFYIVTLKTHAGEDSETKLVEYLQKLDGFIFSHTPYDAEAEPHAQVMMALKTADNVEELLNQLRRDDYIGHADVPKIREEFLNPVAQGTGVAANQNLDPLTR